MGKRANPKTWLVISALFVMMGAPAIASGATIYVDAARNGDGSSWANAYKYLQDALSVAVSGDEIRVAEGIYIPDRSLANPNGSGARAAVFYLKTGVGIYGHAGRRTIKGVGQKVWIRVGRLQIVLI